MGVKRVEDLIAFQLARAFKLEVYRIVDASPRASADFKYKSQLLEAAAGVEGTISEGFYRYRAAEFAQFLSYALASLGEAQTRLEDGIHRRHFADSECAEAFVLAKRCRVATIRLRQSLRRFVP